MTRVHQFTGEAAEGNHCLKLLYKKWCFYIFRMLIINLLLRSRLDTKNMVKTFDYSHLNKEIDFTSLWKCCFQLPKNKPCKIILFEKNILCTLLNMKPRSPSMSTVYIYMFINIFLHVYNFVHIYISSTNNV